MLPICNQCGKSLVPGSAVCAECQAPVPEPSLPEFDFPAPSLHAADRIQSQPRTTRSRNFSLKIAGIFSVGCLTLLVYFGLKTSDRRPLPADKNPALTTEERNEAAQDRKLWGNDGLPRLSGPTVQDGPTFGESKWADLEVIDFGWEPSGPQSLAHAPNEPPHFVMGPFATVKNKSNRIWKDVKVRLILTGSSGERTEADIPIGDIAPAHNKSGVGKGVKSRYMYSSLVGMTGQAGDLSP